VLGKTGNSIELRLRIAPAERHTRKPSPTRDCTADSRLRKSLRRIAWLTRLGSYQKTRRPRGKAAQGPFTTGQIPPPSQETGEVRSLRDAPHRQANLQAPNACGSGGQK
jgi:hypothetical protein